jgi:hypothetical protein
MEISIVKMNKDESNLLSNFIGEKIGDEIDFNRLMPVVEKIEGMGCIVEIWLSGGKGCRITKVMSKTKSWTVPIESNSTIETVYKAVVEFIKWYNENKTKLV